MTNSIKILQHPSRGFQPASRCRGPGGVADPAVPTAASAPEEPPAELRRRPPERSRTGGSVGFLFGFGRENRFPNTRAHCTPAAPFLARPWLLDSDPPGCGGAARDSDTSKGFLELGLWWGQHTVRDFVLLPPREGSRISRCSRGIHRIPLVCRTLYYWVLVGKYKKASGIQLPSRDLDSRVGAEPHSRPKNPHGDSLGTFDNVRGICRERKKRLVLKRRGRGSRKRKNQRLERK